MPQTPMQITRNKLAKVYGIGLLAFAVIVGFVTVAASFLSRLNMT